MYVGLHNRSTKKWRNIVIMNLITVIKGLFTVNNAKTISNLICIFEGLFTLSACKVALRTDRFGMGSLPNFLLTSTERYKKSFVFAIL